ncbi:hypothetical protein [Halorarius litoreus]|uniref:hypothetical protein n=1 Tax=Halorarius litoreus TaxID=2962676 RepID=UPI0020CDE160|nr:hypothetical protein [Halorarius litoreus]
MTAPDLAAATLSERVTLLGLTYLTVRGDVPAHTGQVVETCTWTFDDLGGEVLGNLSEADVSRALNALEASGGVEQVFGDEQSPVGKGRPRYELAVDAERVLASYDDDERLVDIVAFVRDEA